MDEDPDAPKTTYPPDLSKPKSSQALEAERVIKALKENEAFTPAPPKLVK